MWTHEDDVSHGGSSHSAAKKDEGEDLAQRALAAGRPHSLDPAGVLRLQRAAGNVSVSSFLADGEERSPVLDVVGSGRGQALDQRTRAEMETSFGHDFGDVRIHTGGKASESARSVQAEAYTVGNEIVFQGDKYNPETAAGKRMLAHELTHVVQQRSGPVDGTTTSNGVSISHPSDRFEQAAQYTADRVMAGHRAGDAAATPAIQRQEEEGMPDAPSLQRQEAPEEEREEEQTA